MNRKTWVITFIAAGTVLLLDTLMLAGAVFRFPWEKPDYYYARLAASRLLSYYSQVAREEEVQDDPDVLRSIATLSWKIDRAGSPRILVAVISEINGLREGITAKQQEAKGKPLSAVEQYLALRRERSRLRESLKDMEKVFGLTKLIGQGVIVEASDRPGGYLWSEIVHERDIRDIVNSMYDAGAKGVEIGGERLGATSWVRCVGPVVVVNGRAVAANPIVIKAVGDPDNLSRSVKHVQEIFATTGKRLSIKREKELTLLPLRLEMGGGGFM